MNFHHADREYGMQTKHQIPEENKELVREHMGYATAIAHKFQRERPNIDIDIDDYIGAALLGLCDAASRFDPTQGNSFKTYSYLRIRGSLYDLLRKTFGISRSCFEEVTASGEPDSADTGEKERPEKRSSFVMTNDIGGLSSLSVVIEEYGLRIHRGGEDGPALSYANGFDPEEFATNKSLERCLERSMSDLNEKQKQLVYRRYYHAETFDEIGVELDGVSRSWLSRMHSKALSSMRSRMLSEDVACGQRLESYES